MRVPTVGEKLTARDGRVYLVESVDVVEPDYWLAFLVLSGDAHDMQALRLEKDPAEFVSFCQDEGIVYR